jgi:hypothetical protein
MRQTGLTLQADYSACLLGPISALSPEPQSRSKTTDLSVALSGMIHKTISADKKTLYKCATEG